MKIGFQTRKLERICSEKARGIKELGPNCARKLRTRLFDIKAATCLEDLRNVPGRLHALSADRTGQFAMDLEHPKRLVLEPVDECDEAQKGKSLDWRQITAVTVVEIKDYHGK